MAGVTLKFALRDEGVRDHLQGLIDAGTDTSPMMSDIGILLEGETKRRINDTNVAPDGVPWPKSLRAIDDGGKTLRDTGTLENSITFVSGGDYVEVGTNVLYAGIHQGGGDIVPKNGKALAFALPGGGFAVVGKVTIPARPFLGVSETDQADIGDIVAAHFEGGAAQ